MTDAATAYGPAPRVRPTGAPSRPADPRPHLRAVPNPDTLQPETATEENTPSGHVSAGQIVSDDANPGAGPLQIAGWRAAVARSRDYWTPPAIHTDQPASMAELAAYARTAPWTAQTSGPLRTAGVIYGYGVAVPYTYTTRYREWVAQRPGRLLLHLGGIKLAAMTGPGIWLVDHLIYPAAHLVGQILL